MDLEDLPANHTIKRSLLDFFAILLVLFLGFLELVRFLIILNHLQHVGNLLRGIFLPGQYKTFVTSLYFLQVLLNGSKN